ncbi:acireductone synthase [Mycobacterium lacus]|uniref:Enolase-phosphatase E1 n=1 Tax=Mycobacterium lacus TaxID=169765 RepID=A0A1X1XJA1_9MYCO|nr:acireductone synthase [Mycobacterium lacus]MCV7125690.1 acireductone synthase [Mycobacterium lacus]ORV98869.1 enolase [Mycobacterium lacus]BBX98832.1 enolase-phosphatase E1 [Mycobacterium lacus]
MIAAIVIDIEGTTSPTSSVHALFEYTRQRLAQWLIDNVGGAADAVIAGARELAVLPEAGSAEIAQTLCQWLDSDVKAEPLKTLQGLICAEGFRSGALHGEFFDDVSPALRAWHDAGIALYVFSSGSVRNQQDWFAHARGGELASLVGGWFDLANAGGKRLVSSYETIARVIGLAGDQILFVTDHPDELDAAAAAGWSVLGVARPGEPYTPRPPHRWVGSLADVDLAIGG